MGWWYVAYWIALLIIGEVMRPKPNFQDANATSADDANMPTASATAPIPVVFGKCRLRNPNIVWYGDYLAVPIKKKAGKGGFMGTGKTIWQTVGYRYHWGHHLALCHGPVKLHKLWAEEREIWRGDSTGGDIYIDQDGLYGGEEQGGGLVAKIRFLQGLPDEPKDPYLVTQLVDVPAYRGVSSLIWYGPSQTTHARVRLIDDALDAAEPAKAPHYSGTQPSGYIGTTASPRPLTAEVSRYPAQLNAAEAIIGEDANPIEVIYECLTTDPNGPDGWGMGLSPALIDTTSFKAAAHQCFVEGFGISFSWAEQAAVEEVIKEVCKVIDAVCFRDFRTGLWTLKLLRSGYDVTKLPVLDVNNIIELESFSQAGIDGTINEVKVNFTDRKQGYKGTTAQAQDLANMRTQNEVLSTTMAAKSVTTAALADRIANRELLAQSTPLAKADLICNRSAYAFAPGDLFVLSWEPLGISKMVVRVVKSAIGLPNTNRIRLSVVQDVFALGTATYSVGGGTSWQEPVTAPVPVTNQKLAELPYYFNPDTSKASYMVCAERPNAGCVTFEVWEKLKAESQYLYRDTCQTFTPVGLVAEAYKSLPTVDRVGLKIAGSTAAVFLSTLTGASEQAIRLDGANLAMFDSGEFFAFEEIVNNLDGTYTLRGIWGGLFDTLPMTHPIGEKVWFFSYGASNPEDKVGQGDEIQVKNLPFGPRGSVGLWQAAAASLVMTARTTKPYPPGKVQVNGLFRPSTITDSALITWAARNRKTQTQVVRQDDPSDSAAEGVYKAHILVGTAEKRVFSNFSSNELGAATSGGPGTVFTLCSRNDGKIFIQSTYLFRGSNGYGPHCVFEVTATGFVLKAGSLSETGLVNGAGLSAQFQWPTALISDASNNIYIIDNFAVIRKMDSSNVVTTYADLRSLGSAESLAMDQSGNLYVFIGRSLYRVNADKSVVLVAGSSYAEAGREEDGTGEGASFAGTCWIASDNADGVFAIATPGLSGGTKLRYVTAAGVVTTIKTGINSLPGYQIAAIGLDVYYGTFANTTVTKVTSTGTASTFATHPRGFNITALAKDRLAGGFLIYNASAGNVVEYGRLSAAGVFTELFTSAPVNGYTPAMRIQDNANGSLPVECQIRQELSASNVSAYNTTGPFIMTGFGMTFGNFFGGVQQ